MSKEHWNGGSGGKGSKHRPYSVTKDEYDKKFDTIFSEKKKYCSDCGKTFSWCQCKNETNDVIETRSIGVRTSTKEI